MSCDEVREDLVALLDGELAPDTGRAVRQHADECEGCAGELRDLERTRALLADAWAAAPDGVSGEAADATDARFERLWSQVGEADGAGSRRPSARRGPSGERGGRRRVGRTVAVGLAAAAAVALVLSQVVPGGKAPESTTLASRSSAPAAVEGRTRVASGELPPELLEHPDMFVDFVIVRRLEKLRQLPHLLEEEGYAPAAEVSHG